MSTIFLDLRAVAAKDLGLQAAATKAAYQIRAESREFLAIPGAPFIYDAPTSARTAFARVPSFEQVHRTASFGASTKNNFRFLRTWWEPISADPSRWFSHAKGGKVTAHYGNLPLLIAWASGGCELKAFISEYRGSRGWGYQWTASLNGHDSYFRPGLTWSLRADGFRVRVMPRATIFGSKGPAILVADEGDATLLALSALTNSSAFRYLVRVQLARHELAQSYEVGLIQGSPVPESGAQSRNMASLAHRSWSLKRSLDTITETSHAFHLPALLQVSGTDVADRAAARSAHVTRVEAELASIQAEIDDIAFRLYGIDGEDRARIEAESGTTPAPVATDDESDTTDEPDDTEPDDEDDTSSADTATLATEILSWSIGVAFGRFDLRHATRDLPAPAEPGPFDPLPARSPGMCPDDAIAVEFLVDDPGHPLDLGARIADVFAKVFPADHEARLDEAVHLAGSPDLPTFLRRTFFPFHLKRYSKSRRKAPIWWPLSTASGTYTVWLAWPRLTRDTLFRVADEIKRQKLPFETRKLASLKQEHGPNPTTRQRADIAAQEDLVSELTALLEEVERVAPLWNPVHDDGVILHYALLWRVVRDAAWQKECRAAWEKLAKGDYDWAHVAMHLWPERVAPKCRTDRSLAIAQGLEDTFWVEIAGKWRARDNTDAALAAAIAARTSPAVKAALRAFTDAPAPGRSGRGKKGA